MSSIALIPSRFFNLWRSAPATRPAPVAKPTAAEEATTRDENTMSREEHLHGLWMTDGRVISD